MSSDRWSPDRKERHDDESNKCILWTTFYNFSYTLAMFEFFTTTATVLSGESSL